MGEGYVRPTRSTPFPAFNTSGRTTYAKRFNGKLLTGGAASTTRGGTLGKNGRGSVTSAITARERSQPAVRVRAPQSPGARFRKGALESAIASTTPPSPSDGSRSLSELAKLSNRRTPARQATYDTKQAAKRVRARYSSDPKAGRVISAASDALAVASNALVSTAMRPLLGGTQNRPRPRPNGIGAPGTNTGTNAGNLGGLGGTNTYDYGNGSVPSVYGYGYGYGSGLGYWDYGGYYHSPYSSWWGWSFGWSSSWGLYAGSNYGFPHSYYGGYYPHSYYSPYYSTGYYSSSYLSPLSYSYPTVVNQYLYEGGQVGEGTLAKDEDEEIIINVFPDSVDAPAGVKVNFPGEAVAPAQATGAPIADVPTSAPLTSGLGPAPMRYLELGDAAFAEMRFADAVYFYARSLEFEPERGMLQLVLADALFATGDWRYAAFAIKKALRLEPNLVESPVDKHSFYSDPQEFDRQLASLELYYKENPNDGDARLVLALNLLFGGRPEAAVKLLENSPAKAYGEIDEARSLILSSAQRARWGANKPAETAKKP